MRKTHVPLVLLAVVALLATGCSNPKKAAIEQIQRGDRQMAENKLADAVIQYRNAVKSDPMSGEARKKLGEAYLKAGNGNGALSELVRAADLLPRDIEAQLAAGRILLQASGSRTPAAVPPKRSNSTRTTPRLTF